MNDLITSFIRTWTPMLVGSVVAWLTARGIEVSPENALGLTAFLSGLFSALYYAAVRLGERKWPQIGVLLGRAKQVKYTEPK